jgi:folate-dependent phosphoribosylglycinamide formyltransferase PurN
MGHNSPECLEYLDRVKPKLGLISGARILKKEVIDKFSLGIINFHPGGIPDCRGLDTAHWIMYNELDVAVTSHFIDGRVDGGWIIKRQEFNRPKDHTLQDIGSLLYYGQLAIFRESISAVKGKKKEDFEYVPKDAKVPYGYYV